MPPFPQGMDDLPPSGLCCPPEPIPHLLSIQCGLWCLQRGSGHIKLCISMSFCLLLSPFSCDVAPFPGNSLSPIRKKKAWWGLGILSSLKRVEMNIQIDKKTHKQRDVGSQKRPVRNWHTDPASQTYTHLSPGKVTGTWINGHTREDLVTNTKTEIQMHRVTQTHRITQTQTYLQTCSGRYLPRIGRDTDPESSDTNTQETWDYNRYSQPRTFRLT